MRLVSFAVDICMMRSSRFHSANCHDERPKRSSQRAVMRPMQPTFLWRMSTLTGRVEIPDAKCLPRN